MNKSTVGIIDYGMGNILSVCNAILMIGGDPLICAQPDGLVRADRIILPGVGAFRDCMASLRRLDFVYALEASVRRQGKPLLGICLGMQVLAGCSYEGGKTEGLGWFDAEVVRLQPEDPSLRIPQIGWNEISCPNGSPLFAGLPSAPDFYFVHSFYMKCLNQSDVLATCDYGGTVTAAVCKENIFATQFHPEKSQDYGLRVLENFLNWTP